MALRLLPVLLGLVLAASAASAGGAQPASPQGQEPVPVPSLEPAKTAELWKRLAATPRRQAQAPGECRPLRAVFYAASDWLRLATKLAATASPCAEYYISVPPLVADKTRFRPEQARRIRALGSNFHALAEVHFATWGRWVASTGSTWHAAGVTARRNMAEAGYDVAAGDSWALNELSSAVRRGEGNARANVREFLRGLYEGDGSRPTRGAVLVIGFGQRTGDVSVYQNTLQNWLADTAFWADLATYVSDWSQEVYGDLRAHAVPGVPTAVRREYLNDYLQHKLVLAGAAPPEVEPTRAFLRETYSPLANAAWPRETAWGWTMVPAELMASYISAQVNALRWYSATTGQPRDHWGFAWAPRNTTGMSAAEFATRTGLLQDRMAAAIRDSGNVVEPENPGSGACGPPGQDVHCAGDLAEARHTAAWQSFRTWTQAVLRVVTPAQTIPAGTPTAAMVLSLQTSSGARPTTGAARVVTLTSSSPQGTFSTSPTGPWTSTLAVTVAPSVDATFYYSDTRAGMHTITASSAGVTTGTHIVTVTAGPAARLAVTPASASVRTRGVRRFVAAATDAFGNPENGAVTWAVTPAALGTIAPDGQRSAVLSAGRLLGRGTVTATSATLTASASVTVTPANLRIASIAFQPGKRRFRVLLSAQDGARRPVSGTAIRAVVKRDGRRYVVGRGKTGSAGKTSFRAPNARGCFVVTVTRASSAGFRWDGRTPRNRFCRG